MIAAYLGMLVFDAFMLSGTCYLIVQHGWSEWWLAAAFLWACGCAPSLVIRQMKKATS